MKYENFFRLLEANAVVYGSTPSDIIKQSLETVKSFKKQYSLAGLNAENNILIKNIKNNQIYFLVDDKEHPINLFKNMDTKVVVSGEELKQKLYPSETSQSTEEALVEVKPEDSNTQDILDWLEEDFCKERNLILKSTGPEDNGLYRVANKEGKEYFVKVYKDKDGDFVGKLINEEKKPEALQKSNILTSNKLTNTDIQKVGGEVIKFLRKDILNKVSKDLFKNASIQIIGTGKQRESSKLQRYKKRIQEADTKSEPVDFRVVVSLLPSANPGEKWNKDNMAKLLKDEKEAFLNKYAKGITIKDTKADVKYLINFADLNNAQVSDDNGFQGYFDLAATKVIKADNILQKAMNFIGSNVKPLDSSASVDRR